MVPYGAAQRKHLFFPGIVTVRQQPRALHHDRRYADARLEKAGQGTQLPLSTAPSSEFYRHPRCTMVARRDDYHGYCRQFDIYSLGIIRFEICVWTPIVQEMGLEKRAV